MRWRHECDNVGVNDVEQPYMLKVESFTIPDDRLARALCQDAFTRPVYLSMVGFTA